MPFFVFSTIVFTVGPETSEFVPINRGVTQGDPMSPILFNIVFDDLIETLSSTELGTP